MSTDEKPSPVAEVDPNPVVTRPQPVRKEHDLSGTCGLPTIHDVDSSITLNTATPISQAPSVEHDPANPFSAFYSHPQTRYSLEAQRSESKPIIEVTDTDVEACGSTNHSRLSTE